jgi:hypothetical protein
MTSRSSVRARALLRFSGGGGGGSGSGSGSGVPPGGGCKSFLLLLGFSGDCIGKGVFLGEPWVSLLLLLGFFGDSIGKGVFSGEPWVRLVFPLACLECAASVSASDLGMTLTVPLPPWFTVRSRPMFIQRVKLQPGRGQCCRVLRHTKELGSFCCGHGWIWLQRCWRCSVRRRFEQLNGEEDVDPFVIFIFLRVLCKWGGTGCTVMK